MSNILSTELKNTLSHWQDRVVKGEKVAVFFFLLLVTLFYLVTSAGNLSETDDVYAFIYRTENFPINQISDPRLMLYHMSMKLLYLGVNSISEPFGINVRAIDSMRLFSAFCASAVLFLMLRILCRDFKLSSTSAWLATIFLAITYGFWRYAAEAEVYIPATMLCLVIFHLLLNEKYQSIQKTLLIGILGGLTVLFYQPSVIPLFFAFPFLIFFRARLGLAFSYCLSGFLIVVSGYLCGYFWFWDSSFRVDSFMGFMTQRSSEFSIPPMSLWTIFASIVRASFALCHDIISVNWIFASSHAVGFIERVFSNIISEEVYLAQQVGKSFYFLALSQIILLLGVFWCFWQLLINIRRGAITRPIAVIMGWLLLNGAIIGRLNPAGIEAWIMLLAPISMVLAIFVIEPCVKKSKSLFVGFMVALFIHNSVGGMALVMDPQYEYQRVKGQWVIDHATSNDLVIVGGDAGIVEALRYLSRANIIYISDDDRVDIANGLLISDLSNVRAATLGRDFKGQSVAAKIKDTWTKQGRVILFGEFFAAKGGDLDPSMEMLLSKSHNVYQPDRGLEATYVFQLNNVE